MCPEYRKGGDELADEFDSYEYGDGTNATDFGMEEDHRNHSGLLSDPIDFELEDAKRRTGELRRKSILLDLEIAELDVADKQSQVGWRRSASYFRSWVGV